MQIDSLDKGSNLNGGGKRALSFLKLEAGPAINFGAGELICIHE